jgi:hypothetical protein
MEFDSVEIKRIITEIRSSTLPNKENHFKGVYPEFFKKFPKMYFAAADDSFDLSFIDMMLARRADVVKDPTTLTTLTESVQEILNEKYVYPIFPKEELERKMQEMQSKKSP